MAKSRTLLAVATMTWGVLVGCTPTAEEKKEGDKGRLTPAEVFRRLDKDGDGFISREEYIGKSKNAADKARREQTFRAKDKNGDGKLAKEEFLAGPPKKPDGKKPPEKKN